jgi:hypothetical protein
MRKSLDLTSLAATSLLVLGGLAALLIAMGRDPGMRGAEQAPSRGSTSWVAALPTGRTLSKA